MNKCRCGMKAPLPILVNHDEDLYLMKCTHGYCPVKIQRVGKSTCENEWNMVVTDYEWEYKNYSEEQKHVYDLIFEGKSVKEIKQSLKSNGFPTSSYDKCVKSGLVAYWREQKTTSLKKVLLRRNGVLIKITSSYIDSNNAFYSYVYFYFEGKYVVHEPLFCPATTAQSSMDLAQLKITNDTDTLLNQLINKAKSSVCNTFSELQRIKCLA